MLRTDARIEAFQSRLVNWYYRRARNLPWRQSGDPYRIWVSEVMLQQTQVETVIPYYQRFMDCFPTVADLAVADQEHVLKLWEGLGYYARARNMHKAAGIILSDYGGELPSGFEALKALPGIGDYIAAAVSSIAFKTPAAVVDGNVKRVLARLFRVSDPVNKPSAKRIFQAAADTLLNHRYPGDHNQAMMELGAVVCRPAAPACPECPVAAFCEAAETATVAEYPKRLPGGRAPVHAVIAAVIIKNGKLLVTQRRSEGLLGGLWEFPGGRIAHGETPADACRREIKAQLNLTVAPDTVLTHVRHAYTHFRIEMDVLICKIIAGRIRLKGPAAYRWVTPEALYSLPFHKANLKFFSKLRGVLG